MQAKISSQSPALVQLLWGKRIPEIKKAVGIIPTAQNCPHFFFL